MPQSPSSTSGPEQHSAHSGISRTNGKGQSYNIKQEPSKNLVVLKAKLRYKHAEAQTAVWCLEYLKEVKLFSIFHDVIE